MNNDRILAGSCMSRDLEDIILAVILGFIEDTVNSFVLCLICCRRHH